MSVTHPLPKIRFNDGDTGSSPIAAQLMTSGAIRIESDPDSCTLRAAFMDPAAVREFALELTALADLAEALDLAPLYWITCCPGTDIPVFRGAGGWCPSCQSTFTAAAPTPADARRPA